MNFLGVGPAELLVILVVALIFVGPERLPRLAADIARTIREIRKYTGSIAAEFTEVIAEIEKDTTQDRQEWTDIREGLVGAAGSVNDAVRQAHADVTSPSPSGQPTPSAPLAGVESPVTLAPAVAPCDSCGAAVGDGHQFCASCGQRVAASVRS